MSDGIRTIIYRFRDLAKAKAFSSELRGAEPEMDQAPASPRGDEGVLADVSNIAGQLLRLP